MTIMAQRVSLNMLCGLLILSGCAKGVSEEDRLRGIVDEVAEASEKKDAETVSIFVRSVDVEIKGGTALVRANAVLVRGKEIKTLKDIIPESTVGYRFEVMFKHV